MKKNIVIPYNKRLLPLAKKLRQNSTLSEAILWTHIKAGKMMGLKFQRQKPIGNYIVDFFCKELMLVIEVDGNSHDEKVEKDEKREEDLKKMGCRIYRINDVDLKQEIDGVLDGLRDYLEDLLDGEAG